LSNHHMTLALNFMRSSHSLGAQLALHAAKPGAPPPLPSGTHWLSPVPSSLSHRNFPLTGASLTEIKALPTTESAPPKYNRKRSSPPIGLWPSTGCPPPRFETYCLLQGQVGRTPASHGSVYGSGGTEARASTTDGSLPVKTTLPLNFPMFVPSLS
jgi:hypothetical protein